MKDPALKTAAAVCVLLAGVCAATLFRHDRPRAGPARRPRRAAASLPRGRRRLEGAAPARDGSLANDAAGSHTGVGQSTAGHRYVTPADGDEPPPSLAPGYPENDRPAKSRWGVSMDMMLPVATPADETARTHTVVDGDTLAALAERYLGSAARAEEIYQANRDMLRRSEAVAHRRGTEAAAARAGPHRGAAFARLAKGPAGAGA